jgi:TolB-like protein/Tfp pilus assembly protein PilF
MPDSPNKLSQFWQELKRRKVVRVTTVYAAAAFVILELVDIITEPFGLPDWTMILVVVLLTVGFIISVIISWVYDIHPEGGIIKTEPAHKVKPEDIPKSSNSWKIASYISFVVIVALILFHIVFTSNRAKEIAIFDKSIAVLPFKSLSDDPDKQYLADGAMDAILLHLSKIEDLRVMARTSVEQYRETDKTATIICEELDVAFLLEGSFQKYGDQARLIVQLIKPGIESHIWADEYDRDWKDIFAVQSEVAQKIAIELQAVITPEVRERIDAVPTDNLKAHNLYLQGRWFWNQGGRDDLDNSIEYYKRALEIDPEYALAYSGMAATYTSYAFHGYLPRRDVMPQAKTAAMKALAIDNTLGEAHAELAWARVIHDWDWIGGEKRFKRALELNPNYARAHNRYAWLLSIVGRHDEAIEEDKRAHELDPLSVGIWINLGLRYYYARDYDKAIEEYRKVLEIYPTSRRAHELLAMALSQKGLHNEAIEEYSNNEFMLRNHWHLGYFYGVAGKKEKALELLNYYLELSEKEFVGPAIIAFIYIGLGEKDKAFEWLEKTYEQREARLDLLKVEPMYDNLRSDPRFQDLLDRMNFPDN